VRVTDFVLEKPITHRIVTLKGVLQVEPPLQSARLLLFKEFQKWVSSVVDLPRVKAFWAQGANIQVGALFVSVRPKTCRTPVLRYALFV